VTDRPAYTGRRFLPLAIPLAALALAIAAPAAASAAAGFVPGQAIVRFKSGTEASERTATRANAGVSFKRPLRIPGAQLVSVRGSVEAAVARLKRQPDVAYAQPNFVYHALASPPNDPFFGRLWGLRNTGQTVPIFGGGSDPGTPGIDIRALSAWDLTRGAGAVIAIVDTGVDLGQPDIAGNLWTNPNGASDGLHGWDFVANDGVPDDENDESPAGNTCVPDPVYHGSHVAGTAAAIDNNFQGIAGVAPDARIMAVRVLDACGGGSSADIGQGIAYAANHGARVINLSLGGPGGFDPALSSGIDVANARNAVVVAAAGNEGQDNDTDPHVPCNLPQPNLICVAAVDNDGHLPSFSDYGPTTVDVGAPGMTIWSIWGHRSPDNQYQSLDGTSMAAPNVSGVAALVNSGDRIASATQIVQAIRQTARSLPDLQGFTVSGGIVDAAAAIRWARALTTPPPPPPRPPAKASFRRSKRTIRASRSGRFSFSFTAGAALRGRITLVTVRKVSPTKRSRKRRTSFANKTFSVRGSGKVKINVKLSRRNRQILARYKKLRITVSVRLRNAANLTSTAKVTITLLAPKPRRR
jgi:subtilisin family serine protease